jgi:hypothetical protein
MNEVLKIFIITILAELVAVVLLAIVGGFFSKKFRWVLTVIFGRLLDIDVEHVFRNKREAREDIHDEIDHASFIDLLTGRGNELQRDTFAGVLTATPKRVRFRILVPEGQSLDGQANWTLQREKELAAIDPAYGNGILPKQIETNVNFVSSYLSAGNVELKRFNYPHIGRILITDRVAYFTPYQRDAHGRSSRIIKYRRGGEMYNFLARLFDQLWEQETTNDSSKNPSSI